MASLPTKGRRDERTWLRTHAPTSGLSSLATSIRPHVQLCVRTVHTVTSKCGRKEMQPSASAEVRIHHWICVVTEPRKHGERRSRLPQLCFCGSLPRWKTYLSTAARPSRSWSRRGTTAGGRAVCDRAGLAFGTYVSGRTAAKSANARRTALRRMHRGRRRASAIRPQRGSPRPAVRGDTGPTGGRAGGLQHAA